MKLINDKMDRIDENLDDHFKAVGEDLDTRFKAVHDRLDNIEERFEHVETLIAKTHRDFRFLTGHVMFLEQTSYLIFRSSLSDEAKDQIKLQAEEGIRRLEDMEVDETMLEGMKTSKRVMEEYFERV